MKDILDHFKIIVVILIVSVGFFFSFHAFAYDYPEASSSLKLYDNFESGGIGNILVTSSSPHIFPMTFGTSGVPYAYAWWDAGQMNTQGVLWDHTYFELEDSLGNKIATTTYAGSTDPCSAVGVTPACTDSRIVYFSSSSPFFVTAGVPYQIKVINTTPTSTYQIGDCISQGVCPEYLGNFAEVYTQFSSATGTLSLQFPLPGQSVPDFSSWVVSYGNITSAGTMGVLYSKASSTQSFFDETSFSPYVSANPILIPKSVLLNPIVNLFSTSTWIARPYLRQGSSTQYGSQITFVIDPVSTSSSPFAVGLFQNPNYVNATSTESVVACDWSHLSGCLINAGVYLGTVLFQPSPASTQKFQGVLSDYTVSPPFSYGYELYQALSGNLTNVATSTVDLNVPYLFTSGTLPIWTNSMISSFVNQSNSDLYFAYMRAGIHTMLFFAIMRLIL